MIHAIAKTALVKSAKAGGSLGQIKSTATKSPLTLYPAKVAGVKAPLGTAEAKSQFARIEAQASKTGMYGGKSLQWGHGGRSRLLHDRLVVAGKSEAEAQKIVRINFWKKRPLHM